MPFDKLPEDVQNQILPMLGLQPSQGLKHEAAINAVGKLSQAAREQLVIGGSAAGCEATEQPYGPDLTKTELASFYQLAKFVVKFFLMTRTGERQSFFVNNRKASFFEVMKQRLVNGLLDEH